MGSVFGIGDRDKDTECNSVRDKKSLCLIDACENGGFFQVFIKTWCGNLLTHSVEALQASFDSEHVDRLLS